MTKRRQTLNPQRIAEEALALIDKQGLEKFSSRKLGARLGVEGMALYKHYPSMDALLDAVAELLILEVPVPAPQPGGWQARLRQFARDYRQLAYRHPRSYVLLATRRFNTPRSLGVLDALMSGLLEEGFSGDQAVDLFRTVGNFCGGTCLDELAGLHYAERGVGPQAAPHLRALAHVAPFLGPERFEAVFEAGLDAIISGFERRVAMPPTRRT